MVNIEEVVAYEEKQDLWSIRYRKIPVWSYCRGNEFGQFLPYIPIVRFGYKDIVGFFVFIYSVFLLRNRVLVFVSGRDDLFAYSKQVAKYKYPYKKIVFFTRNEGQISGNVFFIEFLRYIFRVVCWLFDLKELRRLREELGVRAGGVEDSFLKNMMGDYWFYKFFLGRIKYGLYSNCVVPRLARYLASDRLCEIQHGVIHEEHLDYAFVPHIKNKIFVYSDFFKNKLHKIHYSGEVEVVERKVLTGDTVFDCVIYSTVSKAFSEEICYLLSSNKNIFLKKHPRDEYDYGGYFDKVLIEAPISSVRVPVLPDTSLIYDALLLKKRFIYFDKDFLNGDAALRHLNIKYGAGPEDFVFFNDIKLLLEYLHSVQE